MHPKVVGAGLGGAIGGSGGSSVGMALGQLIAWWLSLRGVTVPENIIEAFGVLFAGVIAGLCALATGYLTPEGKPPAP